MAGLAAATGAVAQRVSENAVTSAEDAFGNSVGRETIGLYSSSSVRGFSAFAAGNARIDGLFFDPVWNPNPAYAARRRSVSAFRPRVTRFRPPQEWLTMP